MGAANCIDALAPDVCVFKLEQTSSARVRNQSNHRQPDSMKLLGNLSIVASLSLLNAFPCLAVSQADSRLSTQSSSRHSETVTVAGFFDNINDAIETIDRVVDTVDRIEERERADQERQERLEAERQRQEELEAARREATEQQQLEAEQRRQYFESLSPEEQEAYLAEQRAMQQAQVNAATALFLLLISSDGGWGDSSQANPADDYWQEEPPSQEAPESDYVPVQPIDSFYGTDHTPW
jgi:hypothetical protein